MVPGMNRTTMFCCLLIVSCLATAQPAAQSDIGYATVAAALQDLPTKPRVIVAVKEGWTIVDDAANSTIWSFAPVGHAAYPAVVKRTAVERNGHIFLDMRALCEAKKAPCDALMAQFQQMNTEMQKSFAAKAAPVKPEWKPSAQQTADAAALLARFHGAVDAERYQEAYALFTPATKAQLPLDQFVADEASMRSQAGPLTHAVAKTTWYKDPPNAVGPGIFTAYDETCSGKNMASCTEVVILHEPPGGTLQVMRFERTLHLTAK